MVLFIFHNCCQLTDRGFRWQEPGLGFKPGVFGWRSSVPLLPSDCHPAGPEAAMPLGPRAQSAAQSPKSF